MWWLIFWVPLKFEHLRWSLFAWKNVLRWLTKKSKKSVSLKCIMTGVNQHMLYDLLYFNCIWNGSCRHSTLGLYLVCSYLLDWLELMPDVMSDAYCTTSYWNSQTPELIPPPNPHQSLTNILQICGLCSFCAVACVHVRSKTAVVFSRSGALPV